LKFILVLFALEFFLVFWRGGLLSCFCLGVFSGVLAWRITLVLFALEHFSRVLEHFSRVLKHFSRVFALEFFFWVFVPWRFLSCFYLGVYSRVFALEDSSCVLRKIL